MGNFVIVAETSDIVPGMAKLIEAGEREIALFNISGTYYAIDNSCTHVGGPLAEGEIVGDEVVCPWHGSTFKIPTGEVQTPPAATGVNSYNVLVVGDIVEIEI